MLSKQIKIQKNGGKTENEVEKKEIIMSHDN